MAHDVVVVGAGIGGLTTAALLAARGLNVCLLEKESRGGGCVAPFERFGYRFDPGASLYASWGAGEIHDRVFAELPVPPPEVRETRPSYVVRLPGGGEVRVGASDAEFEADVRAAFPECAGEALAFYREIGPIADALHRMALRVPDLVTASRVRRMKALAHEARVAPRALATLTHTAAQHLKRTSTRFRRFIDAQLQIFAQRPSDDCAYTYAALALSLPRRGMYAMRGGAATLADALAESIRRSGGTVRFDAPALRLAYDAGGGIVGVELLSGETLTARRAVVSNLTVWDTYGKLVGLNRTPASVRARLKSLRGWGAFLLFLGMDDEAATRLPSERVLALVDWQEGHKFDAERAQFMLSVAPAWDARAPAGKRAVTVSTFTEAEQWFAFHEDDAELESLDQSKLEEWWGRMHAALPELGAGVEVIETANPRTYYEQTRRRLGMVGGVGQSLDVFGPNSISHRTPFPNLFMVGDTTFPGLGVAAVTHSALIVADEIYRTS